MAAPRAAEGRRAHVYFCNGQISVLYRSNCQRAALMFKSKTSLRRGHFGRTEVGTVGRLGGARSRLNICPCRIFSRRACIGVEPAVSDSSRIIVDIDVALQQAAELAEVVRGWPIGEGIIERKTRQFSSWRRRPSPRWPSTIHRSEPPGFWPMGRYAAVEGAPSPDNSLNFVPSPALLR
jgi:hypothetical protein